MYCPTKPVFIFTCLSTYKFFHCYKYCPRFLVIFYMTEAKSRPRTAFIMLVVEAGGFEPPSANPLLSDLHAYSIHQFNYQYLMDKVKNSDLVKIFRPSVSKLTSGLSYENRPLKPKRISTALVSGQPPKLLERSCYFLQLSFRQPVSREKLTYSTCTSSFAIYVESNDAPNYLNIFYYIL